MFLKVLSVIIPKFKLPPLHFYFSIIYRQLSSNLVIPLINLEKMPIQKMNDFKVEVEATNSELTPGLGKMILWMLQKITEKKDLVSS